MEKIVSFFGLKAFEIHHDANGNFHFVAMRKGSNFIFLKYIDFYFVHLCDKPLTLDFIEENHKDSKKLANTFFSTPKALRLSVPNINTVFVSNSLVIDSIKEYVKIAKHSFIGGEQESIFIIDQFSKQLHSSGIDKTQVSGEARLIWGKSKEFKTINGRNRAFYTIKSLSEELLFPE